MLGNFSRFYCRLLSFFKINFLQKFFQEHFQRVEQFGCRGLIWSVLCDCGVSWSYSLLDPDQAGHSVGAGLGPNCLQKFSADDRR